MKQLSNRAESYLSGLNKDSNWSCDKEMAIAYIEQQQVPLCKPAIRFQTRYSGLDLTIQANQMETFYMRLFSRKAINSNKRIEVLEENGNILFECGFHESAQYNFYMNGKGEILAQSGEDEFAIYSSAEMMIESYALLDSIPNDWYRLPYCYKVADKDNLSAYLLNTNFRHVKDCCDDYNIYFSNGNIIACCSVWWTNEGRFCITVYGKDEKICKQFIEELEKNKLCE